MSEGTPPVEGTPPANASWRDGLDESLRAHPSLTKFEDVPSLAKSYISAQELIGKKGVIKPGNDASDDEMSAFYNELGRPESVEGYELDSIEIPELLRETWDGDLVGQVVSEMHKAGASREVVHAAIRSMAAGQERKLGEFADSVEGRRKSVDATLKKKWGAAFDSKKDIAQRTLEAAAQAIGVPREEIAGTLLPDGGLVGDNPHLMQIFAMLGEGGKELEFLGGKDRRFAPKDPQTAKAELAELRSHPAYYDKSHPEHEIMMAKSHALYAQAHPEEG